MELRWSDIVKVDLLQTGSKCQISLRNDWDCTQKVAMNIATRTTLEATQDIEPGGKLQKFVHFSIDIHNYYSPPILRDCHKSNRILLLATLISRKILFGKIFTKIEVGADRNLKG